MKYRVIVGLLALVLMIGIAGCGKDADSGASSPEDLFNELKAIEISKLSQAVAYIAPDERPLVVFVMDFTASFSIAFSDDEDLEKEYVEIREKHKLPTEEEQEKSNVDLEDMEQVVKFAQDAYGKVDAVAFLEEAEAFLEKLPGNQTEESAKWLEMNDLKIDGDTATATIVIEGGSTEAVAFVKVDGKWYLSQKERF